MIEVVIPIAPISKRIIVTERGAGPLRLSQHDLLYAFFQIRKTGNPNQRKKQSAALLSDSITFIVSNKMGKVMIKNADEIGRVLYRYHLERMCLFVYAKWEGSKQINVKHTIVAFFNRYQITEDDFSLETAYKRVQRFFWKNADSKSTFSLKNTTQPVRLNSNAKRLQLQGLFFADEDTIINLHNSFFEKFYAQPHNAPETYLGFFPNWLDYYYRSITVADISKKSEITQQAVYNRISCFNDQLKYDDDFRKLTEAVLRQFLPNPTQKVLPVTL